MSKHSLKNICPICLHEYNRSEMNKHHLVPKSRKGKVTVLLCKLCHQQLHALFTEKELEQNCATIPDLLAAESLQPWIQWIRRRKPTRRIAVKTSHRKRR